MHGTRHRSGWFRPFALGFAATLIVGCGVRTSILAPKGPAAAQIANIWWLMFGLGSAVFALVIVLLSLALFRPQRDSNPATSQRLILGGGVVLPVLVVTLLSGTTLWSLNSLAARETALTIRVTGWQWWWEIYYPDDQGGFYTANEIHIPVGQPVRLELASGDVVHNFWVPELHGKFDLIPGTTNQFWIQADEPGEYRGLCGEFCGTQHARMQFVVVAETPEAYAVWAAKQREPAPVPTDPLILRGQQLFLGSACVYCHAINGTNANSQFGPDLTHFASRRTIAAGVLPNTRGNLAGWLINPQTIKPGNKMPPVVLDGDDLQALLAYLESLE
jgi:cytochrome c oxidase subunit 2